MAGSSFCLCFASVCEGKALLEDAELFCVFLSELAILEGRV